MKKTRSYEVPTRKLRRICRAKDFSRRDFRLAIPIEMVGQDRAKKALDLALSLGSDSHVVVVATEVSSEAIRDYVEERIRQRQDAGETFPLEDYCYVFNFKKPESPLFLSFSPGEGSIFKLRVKTAEERLRREILAAFSEGDFQKAQGAINREIHKTERDELEKFYKEKVKQGWIEKWQEKGFALELTDRGIEIFPSPPNEELGQNINLSRLPSDLQENFQEMEGFIQGLRAKLMREADKRSKELEDRASEEVIDRVFKDLLRHYSDYPKAEEFLRGLKDYAGENKDIFMPAPLQQVMGPMGPMEAAMVPPNMMNGDGDSLAPFKVNLLVDRKGVDRPPILISGFSTYSELFGGIERKLTGMMGMELKSDLTTIKPGLFHRANGGFVILNLQDILTTKESVILGLNRVLKERALRIRDYSDEYGVSSGGQIISPEPIPLRMKIIAMVSPEVYYALWHQPFFRGLIGCFGIKAEFSRDIKYAPTTAKAYAGYIDSYAREEQLLPVISEAKAKIFEFLLRENADQERFLWDPERLRGLLREANLIAKEENGEKIEAEHIRRALEEKVYRSNLVHERYRRLIKEGILLIDTEGERVGQINILSVFQHGDFKFSVPYRLTATTFKGTGGLVHIERAASFSGNIHTKGTEILKGFFRERYARDESLNFEARLCFEQSYARIDGDSASAAELIILIASLAQVPVKQGLAITGSVNQWGEIQPIGGVNEKIEGFFDICKEKGLTGNQGVVIPQRNLKDLMLRGDVVEAVKDSKFHVFAIESVNQGLEVLTGRSAEEINELVSERLKKWSTKKNKKEQKSQ